MRQKPGDPQGFLPIHPFPARMAASVALQQLRSAKGRLRVLDPFAGSGTSLVVAKGRGHNAIGFDVDPMALVMAKAWLTETHESRIRKVVARVLERANTCVSSLSVRDAYPCPECDRETRQFVRYWFDPINRLQLTALSQAIKIEKEREIRTLLWAIFSRLIITKQGGASLAIDLAHSRPRRVRDRSNFRPLDQFIRAADFVVARLPFKETLSKGTARVGRSDARRLPLPSASIDLIITSPPYLNAIDYFRCHKFSLVWMGYSVADIRRRRAQSIGLGRKSSQRVDTEVNSIVKRMALGGTLSDQQTEILGSFVTDMRDVIREISRVLVPKGKATIAIANSTLSGVRIRNSLAISQLAQRYDLVESSRTTRVLPANRRYLPPPRRDAGSIQKRMRTEIVLNFQKVGTRYG